MHSVPLGDTVRSANGFAIPEKDHRQPDAIYPIRRSNNKLFPETPPTTTPHTTRQSRLSAVHLDESFRFPLALPSRSGLGGLHGEMR